MQAEIGKLLCEVRNNIMGFYKKIEEKQKTIQNRILGQTMESWKLPDAIESRNACGFSLHL